jgi:superfamily II DNA or RNA helicase
MSLVVLKVDNIDTTISGFFPRKQIDAALSYSLPGAFFSPAYRRGGWDGRCHLLQRNKFPTGLLARVVALLKELNVQFAIKDNRAKLKIDALAPTAKDLRPYQRMAAVKALVAQRGFLHVPTGGGKTLIAAAIVQTLKRPALFIVHTRTLLRQTIEEFHAAGIEDEIGKIGESVVELRDVTVATVQSLVRLIDRGDGDLLARFEALFVDECHHVVSDGSKASWYVAARAFENASFRIGLSASRIPDKKALLLEATTGPLIYSVPVKELQDKGYISRARAVFYRVADPDCWALSYQAAYREGIVSNDARNEIAVRVASEHVQKNKLVLVFVNTIEHGERVAEMFRIFSPRDRVIFLCGREDADYIEAYKQRAKARELDVLVATRQLFGEGVDIPAIDVLINLAGGKSLVAFTQTFGRGLRTAPGKDSFTYVDFTDECNRTLKSHAQQRLAHCKKLQQETTIARYTHDDR